MRLALQRKRTRRQKLQRRAEDLFAGIWERGFRWFWREVKELIRPRRSCLPGR